MSPKILTCPAQARHQSQASAISATPATQNAGGCHCVPHLPRETKVDVTKCHAWQRCACHACLAHACHAKPRWMWPSATPATQSATASPATKTSPSAPPEPAQCPKCYACHAKRRWMSLRATPATWNEGGCHACVDVTKCHACHVKQRWMSRLPRKTKVDVTKCHACNGKRRWMWKSATPATQNEGGCDQVPRLPRKVPRRHRRLKPAQARHQSQPSATPATQNADGCHCVPRLPRETKVDVTPAWMWPSATPATWNKGGCHACHAKRRWMWPSATPATGNEGGCEKVPRLPRKTKVDVTKCHACHAKCRGVTGD